MEGRTVTMLLSDLHKIGPSDTPISSSSPPPPPTLPAPFQAGLAWLAWRAPAGYCMQAPRHSPRRSGYLGTWVLRYLTPSSPGGNASWPVQAQPGPNLTPQANSSSKQLTTRRRRLDALLDSVPHCPTSSATETLHEPTHVGVLAEPDSWRTHLVHTGLTYFTALLLPGNLRPSLIPPRLSAFPSARRPLVKSVRLFSSLAK